MAKSQTARTKDEMAREMIARDFPWQTPFRHVLNDTWFSLPENRGLIKSNDEYFIMPLKSNRNVALSEDLKKRGKWVPISSMTFDTDTPMTTY